MKALTLFCKHKEIISLITGGKRMRKRLPITILSALLLAGSLMLSACGETTSSGSETSGDSSTTGTETSSGTTSSGGSSETSSTSSVTIESVSISGASDLLVPDGGFVKLSASVLPSGVSQKVTWSSSNENVATVTSTGGVTFLKVSEDTNVTITAASKEDATKSDSVTFTVRHSVIDLENSYGTGIDTSLVIADEPSVSADPGDVAFIYSDVASTKWYVQSDIEVSTFNTADQFPKFGIMTSTASTGYWNQGDPNAFFYIDLALSSESSGWNGFNFAPSNPDITTIKDWYWGGQLAPFSVNKRIKKGEVFTMGLLRDGIDYYLFVGLPGEETPTCYKHIQWNMIPAETPSYAWVGGWNTGITASNYSVITDPEDVEALFTVPTSITLNKSTYSLNYNESYQLTSAFDNVLAKGEVTWSVLAGGTDIVTVSQTGKVTALEKEGTATVRASSGDIYADCVFTVRDANAIFDHDTAVGDWDFTNETADSDAKIVLADTKSNAGTYHYVGFKGVSATKWFASMTIKTTALTDLVDRFPKIGIASASADYKKAVWFGQEASLDTGSKQLDFPIIVSNGAQIFSQATYCDVNPGGLLNNPRATLKLGMLRDGNFYYYFLDGALIGAKTETSNLLDGVPSVPAFIECGGLGATITDYVVKTGTDVDAIIAKYATETIGDWKKTKDVVVDTANDTLQVGTSPTDSYSARHVGAGFNTATYGTKANGAFEIEYDVSDYYSASVDWYFPKAALIIQDNYFAYSVRVADPTYNIAGYARFESKVGTTWQNGTDWGVFDAVASHHVKLTCSATGDIAMFLDGASIAYGTTATRNIGVPTDYTILFSAEKATFKISNFTYTPIA